MGGLQRCGHLGRGSPGRSMRQREAVSSGGWRKGPAPRHFQSPRGLQRRTGELGGPWGHGSIGGESQQTPCGPFVMLTRVGVFEAEVPSGAGACAGLLLGPGVRDTEMTSLPAPHFPGHSCQPSPPPLMPLPVGVPFPEALSGDSSQMHARAVRKVPSHAPRQTDAVRAGGPRQPRAWDPVHVCKPPGHMPRVCLTCVPGSPDHPSCGQAGCWECRGGSAPRPPAPVFLRARGAHPEAAVRAWTTRSHVSEHHGPWGKPRPNT